MENALRTELETAQYFLECFAKRSGLTETNGDTYRRYLWTDALALQSYLGLHRLTGEEKYVIYARKLINEVHEKLGRYHLEDQREGFISGLEQEEAWKHPTINGLRIGKRLRERKADEAFDEQLEWEKDGQYLHYLTKWTMALLQAEIQLEREQYGQWARELVLAQKKFINNARGKNVQLYWKMSVDLSRPQVLSSGAHDPLEAYFSTLSVTRYSSEEAPELHQQLALYETLIQTKDWTTSDPLGLGTLLLNAVQSVALQQEKEIPSSVKAGELLKNACHGLDLYRKGYSSKKEAHARLAFRECGLALGLRVIDGLREQLVQWQLDLVEIDKYMHLAEEIEGFWLAPENRNVDSWTAHLDINEVSLAAVLVAKEAPEVFVNVNKGHYMEGDTAIMK